MHEKLRHQLLGLWAGWVCRHPRIVLTLCLVAWLGSVAVTADRLRFLPDRNQLISPHLPWNCRYIDYRRNFNFDELIVVVEADGRPTGRRRAEQFVRALAGRLEHEDTIAKVIWGFDENDPSAVSPAAVRMLPWKAFCQQLDVMAQAEPLLGAGSVRDFLERLRMSMAASDRQDADPATITGIAEMIDAVTKTLARVQQACAGKPVEGIFTPLTGMDQPRWRFFEADQGRLLLMRIRPRFDERQLEPVTPAVRAVRRHLDQLKRMFPQVRAGITGVPVIESDETATVQRDATLASVIAFVLIAVLLVVSFHCWRIPLLIVAALLVGVGWTFGFLTLAIGHLQLLSVTFTVILLGLGVDFGIHLISRFELARPLHDDGPSGFIATMIEAFQEAGPGVITGAVTTALAFATTLLTDFRGMAEMGLIAGVGILLCLLAMFTVLPALIRLVRPKRGHITPVHQRRFNLYQHHWWQPLVDRPWIPLSLVAVTLLACIPALPPRYDYDLSKLLPNDVESVRWFHRLEQAYRPAKVQAANEGLVAGIWFGALPIKHLDYPTARRRTEAFRRKASVLGVGGAGRLFPPDEPRKLARMRQVRDQLAALLDHGPPDQPEAVDPLHVELQILGLAARQGAKQAEKAPAIQQALDRLAEQVAQTDTALLAIAPADRAARLGAIHRQFIDLRQISARRIRQALAPRDLTVDDLPVVLQDDAVGGPDRDILLLSIYPRANVYDPAALETFVADLMAVDSRTTGTVVQIYRSNQLIMHAYIYAAIYAMIAVFLIVLLDFQSLVDALLCLLPVGGAFIVLLGLMAYLDIPVNPANIIILPLLFGMGVDSGVHMVHRYRKAPEEHPPGLTGGTGKGITMTSLTTIFGFASLLVARHQGIFSLGLVLTIGMTITLLACLAVMPAVLELRGRLGHTFKSRGAAKPSNAKMEN